MPINSTHPEYDRVMPFVMKTKDAFEGDVQKYVPKLSGQSNDEYRAYQQRSSYYNMTERTCMALIGALMRKPYTLEYLAGDDPVCSEGEDFDDFISECYQDILTTGRVGILVDYNDMADTPYLVGYNACCVVNWSDNFVVIMEHYYDTDPNDQYQLIKKCQYRELYLDELGFYSVRIWRQPQGSRPNGDKWVVYETYEPSFRGMRLEYIPFWMVNPYEVGCDMYKPVLSTLADINIDHFKTSVDIGHGAHFLAIPTPWIAGNLQDDQTSIRLGTNEFIQLQQDGKIGFLEFSGQGLGFLKDMLIQKEDQMNNIGSKMLQYKKGVESSDALNIRLGTEGAMLLTLANALEEGLRQALETYNYWMGIDPEIEVELELNKDFSPVNITPQEMTGLLTLFQKDVISLDTLLQRLYEGEIIDDVQEELEKLTGQEEQGEELEKQVEGPNSEEINEPEELDIMMRDEQIRSKAQ